MTDPAIVSDQDAVGPPPLEEGMVALRGRRVIFGAIGKSMLRRAVERMVWRADAHLGCDRAKPANLRIGDHAAGTEIGEVAELGLFECGVIKNFAATADRRLPQFNRGVDDGFRQFWAPWSRLVHIDCSSSNRQPAAAKARPLS